MLSGTCKITKYLIAIGITPAACQVLKEGRCFCRWNYISRIDRIGSPQNTIRSPVAACSRDSSPTSIEGDATQKSHRSSRKESGVI
jgi:hypothetical protein